MKPELKEAVADVVMNASILLDMCDYTTPHDCADRFDTLLGAIDPEVLKKLRQSIERYKEAAK